MRCLLFYSLFGSVKFFDTTVQFFDTWKNGKGKGGITVRFGFHCSVLKISLQWNEKWT